jgi:hypothetical protein
VVQMHLHTQTCHKTSVDTHAMCTHPPTHSPTHPPTRSPPHTHCRGGNRYPTCTWSREGRLRNWPMGEASWRQAEQGGEGRRCRTLRSCTMIPIIWFCSRFLLTLLGVFRHDMRSLLAEVLDDDPNNLVLSRNPWRRRRRLLRTV